MSSRQRLLVVLLSLALVACSRRSVSRIAPTETGSPPASSAATNATAGPSPAARQGALVAEGYRALLGSLVLPVQADSLIQAAWQGVVAEAGRQGVSVAARLSPVNANSDQDLLSFERALSALVSRNSSMNQDALERAALTAMAESVRDCHTAYLTRDQWNSVNADLNGSESIDSLPLTFQLAAPYLVESVVDGSNAATAGVKPGDQILSADGTPLDKTPLSQRKFLSYGAAGSSARLELQSPGGARRTVSVTRESVERPIVSQRLFGDVGYIRLRTFTVRLGALLDPVMLSLQAGGAKSFVIDLRGNLGGELDSDVHLLSRFIPSGVLATTNERNGPARAVRATGSALPGPPPLVVLVDGGSLSASELFASDIKQYGAGELVGTPTPGCLLGSSFQPLSDGSAMQISSLDVHVGPQNLVVNNVGVQPDIAIPLTAGDLAAGRDPQLDRAVAEARSRSGR